jgi:hypothetical protein
LSALHENDPLAYLIRHRSGSNGYEKQPKAATTAGLTRTGLKMQRAKTSKLQLETMPLDSATYNISAKPSKSSPSDTGPRAQITDLIIWDPYLIKGEKQLMTWDLNSDEITTWESRPKQLVRNEFVANFSGEMILAVNLQIKLTVALGAYVEG